MPTTAEDPQPVPTTFHINHILKIHLNVTLPSPSQLSFVGYFMMLPVARLLTIGRLTKRDLGGRNCGVIKVLPPHLPGDKKSLKNLSRTVRILAKNFPNTISLVHYSHANPFSISKDVSEEIFALKFRIHVLLHPCHMCSPSVTLILLLGVPCKSHSFLLCNITNYLLISSSLVTSIFLNNFLPFIHNTDYVPSK
jgi:hypothetical protein